MALADGNFKKELGFISKSVQSVQEMGPLVVR